ncbi:MAG: aminopeptidase P family protein [Chloroflexi bacterium]|nr:aminopeptidase P family protein [Chloroflexota bacterium]
MAESWVTQNERERRHALLRRLMAESGLDTLLIVGSPQVCGRGYFRYITDWSVWSSGGYALFFAKDDPIVVMRAKSQAYWSKQIWVKDSRSAEKAVVEVGRVLAEKRPASGVVGIVGMGEFMSLQDYFYLQAELPSLRFQDASAIFDRAMRVKSAEEIGHVEATARILDEGFQCFAEMIAPGRTGWELSAELQKALYGQGCLHSVILISTEPGPYNAAPGERPLSSDDIVKFSLEACGPSGHWVEIGGMFSFRRPPDYLADRFDSTLEAVERAVAKMRPGFTVGDVGEEIENTVARRGHRVGHWSGHACGLGLIEPPMIGKGEPTPLEAGMELALHPNIIGAELEMGIYVSQTYIVEEAGARQLSRFPNEWHLVS